MTFPLVFLILNLSSVAVPWFGGQRVDAGQMQVGSMTAFLAYLIQILLTVLSVVGVMLAILPTLALIALVTIPVSMGVASAERVFDLLDAEDEVAESSAPAGQGARRGQVEFQGASFRYAPDTPIITDLSLVADPGHTVAIVGPTGAGKMTMVNLILRFYEVDAGRITLDDVDIGEMRRADLRGKIGMVLQDTWLFEGTIRDADLILVMEAGRIVEQGTHDELLRANGAYAALYNTQFSAALVA